MASTVVATIGIILVVLVGLAIAFIAVYMLCSVKAERAAARRHAITSTDTTSLEKRRAKEAQAAEDKAEADRIRRLLLTGQSLTERQPFSKPAKPEIFFRPGDYLDNKKVVSVFQAYTA